MAMPSNNNKSTCNYCKKRGHLEINCFKKYPNLKKDKKKVNTINNSDVIDLEQTILNTSTIIN